MELAARADRLAQLMEERLDIRGRGLEAKLARARRRLPKHMRMEIEHIVLAQRMEGNPKLAAQIDWDRIEKGFGVVEHYLRNVDPWDRRKAVLVDWLAVNAFNIALVIGLVIAVLAWRGFV